MFSTYMPTHRQLKLDLLKERADYTRKMQSILSALLAIDQNATVLTIDKAVASRTLVKTLWDLLPVEQESHAYDTIAEQTTQALNYLPTTDLTQNVTLQLGWDLLCFNCTLEAAWHAWQNFNTLDIDTFNCCIYPEHLEWYMVRAGNNFYPMQYLPTGYELIKK